MVRFKIAVYIFVTGILFGISYCSPALGAPPCRRPDTIEAMEKALKVIDNSAKSLAPTIDGLNANEIAEQVSKCHFKLRDKNLDMRLAAAVALGKIGTPAKEAIPDLIQTLYKDRGDWRSFIFAGALVHVLGGPEEAILHLAPHLHDSPSVRATTVGVLKYILSNLDSFRTPNMDTDTSGKKGDSLESLVPVVHTLVEMAANEPDLERATPVDMLLRELPPPLAKVAVSDFRTRLQSKDPDVRLRTAVSRCRVKVQDDIYIPDIVEMALSDPDNRVRGGVTKALVEEFRYYPNDLVPLLQPRLKEKDANVRAHAAEILGYFNVGAKTAIPELLRALGDENSRVRGYAAAALIFAGQKPEGIVQHLQAALSDSDATLRMRALQGVDQVDDEKLSSQMSSQVTALLADPDTKVRDAAMKAAGLAIKRDIKPLRQRKSVYDISLEEILSSNNRLAFPNPPGPRNTGLCWWHTQMQRNAYYLADFQPEKPRLRADYYKKAICDLSRGNRVVAIPGFKNLYEFSKAYEEDFVQILADMQSYDWFPNGIVSVFRLPPRTADRVANRAAYEKLTKQLDDGKLPVFCYKTGPQIGQNHNYLVFQKKNVTSDTVEFFGIDSNDPTGVVSFYWHKKDGFFEAESVDLSRKGAALFFGGGDEMGRTSASVIRTTEYPEFERAFKKHTSH